MTSDVRVGSIVTDPRELIDQAARKIATSQGLPAITLRRVASTSGLAPGDVAAREPSMSSLAARTFADLAVAEMSRIHADIQSAATPLEALQRLVAALLSSEHSLSKTVWADAWSVGRHNEFVAVAARESMVAWEDLLIRLIEDGISAEQFVTDDPEFAARQFFAVIDSTTAYGLVGYLTETARAELVTRTLETSLGLPASSL